MTERRQRSMNEHYYRRRRIEVEQHFNRLKSEGNFVLPTLAEFRKLPVMQLVQGKVGTSNNSFAGDLKNSLLIAELIQGDLRKWMEPVVDALSSELGYPNWKSASTKKLSPVKRLTARFKCKRCDRVAKKYSNDGCLDFEGVCAHQCPHLSEKEAKQGSWRVEDFVKDEKAIRVISQALTLCGAREDDPSSADVVKSFGPRFKCLSCSAKIVMGFSCLVGHAHRHDEMKVELEAERDIFSINIFPILEGRSATLMNLSYRSKKQRELRVYGCRHCLPGGDIRPEISSSDTVPREGRDTARAATAFPSASEEAKRHKKIQFFSFDGLRSHAKNKHHIELLRDEDLFYQPPSHLSVRLFRS
ncbi:hypothetical protein SERLA73DRAFT_83960 [Serpula lacrymans var. lacrymans S7.3]|uniref:Uncharacterized protein n=1 Tax=Serpula lacrymans var. lacrymans (strain S7.3) TaxID=936435 RepID=F8PJX9_SERL3|nr:hypothetical protein SERLA73DRAFT_83960 [Serpula lacrymans var. lacrymans S7.3]